MHSTIPFPDTRPVLQIRAFRAPCHYSRTARAEPSCRQNPNLRRRNGHTLQVYCSQEEAPAAPRIKGAEYRLTLKRPMGMTLAENIEKKEVFVESLVPGGNAEATNKIRVGDVISKCSAITLKSGKDGQFEKEGYGQRPYTNWETIEFDCHNQDFGDVMKAIDSNNPRWGINTVTLVFRSQ